MMFEFPKDLHPQIVIVAIFFTCHEVLKFTTRPPAVTDVLGSGRNVGALRPGRRVGFQWIVRGVADDIFSGTYYFCKAYSS